MFNLFKASPEQQQIQEATNPDNLDDDWKAYLEISDKIKIAPDKGRKLLKAILKRAQHKDERQACFALTLLGSCVANDDIGNFHDVVATDQALNVLVKLGKKAKSFNVRDKALALIRKWAEEFSRVHRYPIFNSKYRGMLKEGVVFPDVGNDAPVLTPQASHDPNAAQDGDDEGDEKKTYNSSNTQYIFKLKNDLLALFDYINTCRALLKPIASQYKGRKVEKHEILMQMTVPFLEIQSRLNTLIVTLQTEKLIDLTLKLGEEVHLTVEWINAIQQGRDIKPLGDVSFPMGEVVDDNEEKKKEAKENKTAASDQNVADSNNDNHNDAFAMLARRREKKESEHKQQQQQMQTTTTKQQGSNHDILGILGAAENKDNNSNSGIVAGTGAGEQPTTTTLEDLLGTTASLHSGTNGAVAAAPAAPAAPAAQESNHLTTTATIAKKSSQQDIPGGIIPCSN